MCGENHYAHLGPAVTLFLSPGYLPYVVNDEETGNANGHQTVPGSWESIEEGEHLGTEWVSTANLS